MDVGVVPILSWKGSPLGVNPNVSKRSATPHLNDRKFDDDREESNASPGGMGEDEGDLEQYWSKIELLDSQPEQCGGLDIANMDDNQSLSEDLYKSDSNIDFYAEDDGGDYEIGNVKNSDNDNESDNEDDDYALDELQERDCENEIGEVNTPDYYNEEYSLSFADDDDIGLKILNEKEIDEYNENYHSKRFIFNGDNQSILNVEDHLAKHKTLTGLNDNEEEYLLRIGEIEDGQVNLDEEEGEENEDEEDEEEEEEEEVDYYFENNSDFENESLENAVDCNLIEENGKATERNIRKPHKSKTKDKSKDKNRKIVSSYKFNNMKSSSNNNKCKNKMSAATAASVAAVTEKHKQMLHEIALKRKLEVKPLIILEIFSRSTTYKYICVYNRKKNYNESYFELKGDERNSKK
jgi:hypothetical protein